MKIYHYTSIETLAKILSSKKIRFKSLRYVDDPDEYDFGPSMSPEVAKYFFVTCWTRQKEENMPQWIIYGNERHGVRIGMDEDMFKVHEEYAGPGKKRYSLFADNDFKGKGFRPMFKLNDSNFLYDINYVNNLKEIRSHVLISDENSDYYNLESVAMVKSMDWKFQHECRFMICVTPHQEGYIMEFGEVLDELPPIEHDYFDIKLLDNAYSDMEIMIGPDVTEAEKFAVLGLMQKYLGHTNLEISKYNHSCD